MTIYPIFRTGKPSSFALLAALCLLTACSPRHHDDDASAGPTEPTRPEVQAQSAPTRPASRAAVAADASTPPVAGMRPQTRLAPGQTMQPYGPNPEPGQVLWPSQDTPPPAAATIGSPFGK